MKNLKDESSVTEADYLSDLGKEFPTEEEEIFNFLGFLIPIIMVFTLAKFGFPTIWIFLPFTKYLINISIGQNFITHHSNYIYTINPFDVIIYDEFLEKYADMITSTSNKNLLLDIRNLYENSIFMCLNRF